MREACKKCARNLLEFHKTARARTSSLVIWPSEEKRREVTRREERSRPGGVVLRRPGGILWCSVVVWCGVVWCGVVWCGVV